MCSAQYRGTALCALSGVVGRDRDGPRALPTPERAICERSYVEELLPAVAALDVADDVRTVHCDVMAVGIGENEGRMDSPALDWRHVETQALPCRVRCFEVFDREIEGRLRVTWRVYPAGARGVSHRAVPAQQSGHSARSRACRRCARSLLIDQCRSLSGGRGRSRRDQSRGLPGESGASLANERRIELVAEVRILWPAETRARRA